MQRCKFYILIKDKITDFFAPDDHSFKFTIIYFLDGQPNAGLI